MRGAGLKAEPLYTVRVSIPRITCPEHEMMKVAGLGPVTKIAVIRKRIRAV